MDLIILVLVIALVCFVVNWILTNLAPNPVVVKLVWFLVVLALLFFALRQLGITIPNVIH